MGIILDISLDKDIREIDAFFDDLKFKAITLAARQGLNRAARNIKATASKEIRKQRKMKVKEVRGRIKVTKATGLNIANLEARIDFSGASLPLIMFILGKKTPKTQTLRNTRRKSRRFEIAKGQKKAKKGLFIQKAKRGKRQFQVFRRSDPNDKSKGFKMQSAPSIAELLRKKTNVLRRIENSGIASMQREYDKALAFQLSKLKL